MAAAAPPTTTNTCLALTLPTAAAALQVPLPIPIRGTMKHSRSRKTRTRYGMISFAPWPWDKHVKQPLGLGLGLVVWVQVPPRVSVAPPRLFPLRTWPVLPLRLLLLRGGMPQWLFHIHTHNLRHPLPNLSLILTLLQLCAVPNVPSFCKFNAMQCNGIYTQYNTT